MSAGFFGSYWKDTSILRHFLQAVCLFHLGSNVTYWISWQPDRRGIRKRPTESSRNFVQIITSLSPCGCVRGRADGGWSPRLLLGPLELNEVQYFEFLLHKLLLFRHCTSVYQEVVIDSLVIWRFCLYCKINMQKRELLNYFLDMATSNPNLDIDMSAFSSVYPAILHNSVN
jgi:hypothetical protein